MKKLLSVLLVVLMLVGMLPMNAIHTHAATANYVKVTSAPSDWTGTYLIVCEDGNVAFNGELTSLDAVSNTISVTIANNSIEATDTVNAAAFTINSSGHIKSASGYYIGQTSNANGMKSSTSTTYTNTLSVNTDGTVNIVSGGAYLRYNASSGQYRFRYYKSSSYSSQKAICLYKLEEAATSCTHSNLTATAAKTATCTEGGNIAYWYCDDCQKYFSDKAATTEITEEQTKTSALGHSYVNGTCETCGDTLPVVSFVVPESVTAIANKTSDENGNVELPTAGVPTGDHTYTFAGWTTDTIDNETTVPTIYKAGETFTATAATTLYALYTYEVEGEGTGSATDYELYSGELTEGDYIIVYDGGAMNTTVSSSRLGYTDVTISNGVISNPATSIIWHIAPDGVYWTIYNDADEVYAAGTGSKNKATTITSVTDYARWTVSGSETYEFVNKGNAASSVNANLRRNGTFGFACYSTSTGGALSLYKAATSSSTTYYTTVISSTPAECTHENTTTTTVNATCTENGSVTVTCDDCETVISRETLEATGHSYVDVVTPPTCTESGYTTHTCSACDHSYTDAQTEATGHNYVDGACETCGEAEPASSTARYYIAAKRTAAGSKLYYMTNALTTTSTKRYAAEATELTEVPEFIENPEEDKVFVLVDNGDGTFCIYAEGITGDAKYLGHDSGNSGAFVAKSDAKNLNLTYNDDGSVKITYDTRKLTLNNNTGNDYFAWYESEQADVYLIPVKDPCEHESTENHDAVAPTCTAVGYTAGVYCTDCETYISGHEVVAKIDHIYNDGVVTTAPSCTTAGIRTYTCSACGDTKTETVAATGHTMGEGVVVDPTCETAGSETYTCTVCGEEQVETIPAINHNWVESERTDATCDTDGKISYICSNDSSHTKTETIPPKGHQFSNGVCSVCGKEVSRFQLVADYTEILAGGEYIVAARVGDNFYAIDSDYSAYPIAVTGTGAEMMVVYADGLPYWNVQYYLGRNNCISLRNTSGQYLAGTDGTGLTLKDSAWAWTFIDGCTENGQQTDGTFAVTQEDGSVAYVLASATILDRAISLKDDETGFMNYSVRTSGYNRELYFFKMVRANVSEYTVKFIENGTTTITMKVPANENGLKMPQPIGNAMPEGYTKFVGWVEVPHTESMVAPANIFSAEEGDGFNNTTVINEDKTFYALYSREDADGEGQTMDYHLVTDNNQLVVGQKYIIVGVNTNGQYYAMSNQLSGDRNGTSVTPDANGVITFAPGDNVAVLELAQGSVLGTYAFLDLGMNQFLYCASNSTENALKSNAALDEKASFVITINADGSYSVITSQAAVDRSSLMFNTIDTNSKIFSCYDIEKTSVNPASTFLYVGVPNSTFATYYTTGLCVHDWVLKDSQQASCTQPGYTMYACSICGEIKMEDVKAHGHDVGESNVTVEPTCTTTGLATSTCNKCGEEFTETIPALGHTEVVDDAVAASCTETGLTEGKHCSVCNTVLVPQQVAPALGHDFDAAKGTVDDKGNYPVVVYPCRRCDEKHIAAELKFTNASLTLENNIVVNFKTSDKVAGDSTYGGFTNLRAVFTYGYRTGDNAITAEGVLLDDGRYNLACRRVTPSQIGDEITATLYGTFGGTEYSFEMKYSAAEYCYAMLETTTDTKLQTLLVDLLYFCDAAREYTTYQGVDETYEYYGSVTKNLSEDQKAFRTTAQPTCKSVMGVSEGEYAVTWQSASLIIGDTTSIQFTVNMGDALLTNDMIRVTVGGATYTDVDCRKVGDVWQIRVFGLAAHQMRETVQVTLYSGDVAISQTVSYSIESYVARKMQNSNTKLVDMLIAMMKYGDAAVAYKP